MAEDDIGCLGQAVDALFTVGSDRLSLVVRWRELVWMSAGRISMEKDVSGFVSTLARLALPLPLAAFLVSLFSWDSLSLAKTRDNVGHCLSSGIVPVVVN